MFLIAPFAFLTWNMLATSAARVKVPSGAYLATSCDSEYEKRIAERLWSTATNLHRALENDPRHADGNKIKMAMQKQTIDLTPFASCSPERRDLPLENIANEEGPLALCDIGKLAKGGTFLASVDGSVVVKHVDSTEAHELAEWGKHARVGMFDYPGGCDAFRTTLLVEATLSFNIAGSAYIVMPNLTYSFAHASPKDWTVVAVYDAKPLPNLGKGLVHLFRDVSTGWGVDLPKISGWLGWEQVQGLMLRDMKFLSERVIDFSLFVHVLRREGEGDLIPDLLGPSEGCIVEPGRSLLICFHVLDYLTPFSWLRRIESHVSASKYHDYAGKFLVALNCLSNVDQPGCESYKSLAAVSEAMEVSKNMAKAVFIGSTAFREAYTCSIEIPSLLYTQYLSIGGFAISAGAVIDEPVEGTIIAKGVEFMRDRSSSEYSDWLQGIASPEVAYSVGEKFEANMELAYGMSEVRGHTAHRMPEEYLEVCVQTVKEFGTESYLQNTSDTDMLNVLWEDGSEHVIVVRGLPPTYEHKEAVRKGRLRNCFLETVCLRCDPKEKHGFYFNYKQHFGVLEVMVMSTRQHSDDMNIYLRALQNRESIPTEDEVKTLLR